MALNHSKYSLKNNTPQPDHIYRTGTFYDTSDWVPMSSRDVKPILDADGTIVGYLVRTRRRIIDDTETR